MRHRSSKLLVVTAALALGGCQSRSDAPLADDVQRDLQAASSASIELAPAGSGTGVVSAVEQGRSPRPATRAPRAPRIAAPAETSPTPTVAEAPEEASEAAVTAGAPAPRPTPVRPAQAQRRNGRYKTTAEIIRDAPFPINP